MPQYVVGQVLDLHLKLKVLRAFAIDDVVYYVVGVIRKDSVLRHTKAPMYGVFRNDGSFEKIPPDALKRADELVVNEKLLENLE